MGSTASLLAADSSSTSRNGAGGVFVVDPGLTERNSLMLSSIWDQDNKKDLYFFFANKREKMLEHLSLANLSSVV